MYSMLLLAKHISVHCCILHQVMTTLTSFDISSIHNFFVIFNPIFEEYISCADGNRYIVQKINKGEGHIS